MSEIELSYCIVNTSQRQLMLRGLDAIARERDSLRFATEVLVLDNGSRDGSVEAARSHPALTETAGGQAGGEVIALGERRGKARNDSELLRRARGRYALLLNEDSELLAGATLALHEALEHHPSAACAGAKLMRPEADARAEPLDDARSDGTRSDDAPADARTAPPAGARRGAACTTERTVEQACAWRFPTPLTALASALLLQRLYTVQSKGEHTREVDWCQSSTLLVRREAAAQVGYLDPDFFVYSDEVDFARRLRDAGWSSLYVPSAGAIHHEQLSTGAVPQRRIVELSRNRDLYMRKHHSSAAAGAVRWLTALSYAERALAALLLPEHSATRYWRHVTATLFPSRGEGLREAAEIYNRSCQ